MDKTVFRIEAPLERNGWKAAGEYTLPDGSRAERFSKGSCQVLLGHEDHGNRMRWHLSISCPHRYPKWEEIKDARYSLMPHDITVAQILPPPREYTNIHRNCFHLWEIEDGEW